MTNSNMKALNDARPGMLSLAIHPAKPEVLITIEGTTVVLGMTIEQVDAAIDQLTIVRDRVVHRELMKVPHRPTPTSGPQ